MGQETCLHKQAATCETLLGMRLFERRARSLELTSAGHRLLDEVEPLLDGLDRTLAQLARQDGRETLRVRAPALFANELLIPRLEAFCQAHPLIDVQLDTRDPRPVAHPPTRSPAQKKAPRGGGSRIAARRSEHGELFATDLEGAKRVPNE